MLSHLDPLNRFTGRADCYARHRPDYPEAAVEFILTTAALGPAGLLVDVGCGTGISSRLFAARGVPVLGIEPNDDMRRIAAETPLPEGRLPEYRPGQAETTGLPDGCATAVLAAQAFHWFQPEPALREFHRLLRPGGWVFLMWNERDMDDPCTAAYGAVIRTAPGAPGIEKAHREAGEVLLTSPLYEEAQRVVFHHQQELDEDGLLGRAFSVSYAPSEPAAVAEFAAALHQVFSDHQQGGRVTLQYLTSVYCGRRVG